MTSILEEWFGGPTLRDFPTLYERQICLARPDRARFAELIDQRDIETLIASLAGIDSGAFGLIKGGPIMAGADCLDARRLLSLSAIYSAYAEGHTVLLTKLDRRLCAVGALTRRVEHALFELGIPLKECVGANLYATPKGAQGFPRHRDTHNFFALQVHGKKLWTLYPPGAPSEQREILLEPGDVLYVPRGFEHEARTSDEPSVHITCSVHTLTFADLLARVFAQLPLTQAAVPACWLQRPDLASVRGHVADALSSIDQACVERVRASLTRDLFAHMAVLPGAGLRNVDTLEELSLDSKLVKRSGVFTALTVQDEECCLYWPGGHLSLTKAAAPALEFVHHERELQGRQVPLLVAEDALDLMRRLVCEGVLEVVTHNR